MHGQLMTRRPASLSPPSEGDSADAAIFALVRLLARQAAAEVMSGVSHDSKDDANGQDADPRR